MIKDERKQYLQSLDVNFINIEFKKAAENKNLDEVKYLLTSNELKSNAYIHVDGDWALVYACKNGDLEMVKYLLTSSDLDEHGEIYAGDNESLTTACSFNHVEVAKYLLTSPELKKHAEISYTSKEVVEAAENGNLNILKLLMETERLKIDIDMQKNIIMKKACINGQLEIVKYLLTSPTLKQKSNIDGYCIIAAHEDNHDNIVDYLMFDYGIKKDDIIDRYLSIASLDKGSIQLKAYDLKKKFDIVDINKRLDINLSQKESNNTKVKI